MENLLAFLGKKVSVAKWLAIILVSALLAGAIIFYYFFQPVIPTSIDILHRVVQADLNREFQLKYGRKSFIAPENITIKFSNVTEDSRCPAGVECTRAGQATITVNVSKNSQNVGDFNLTIAPNQDSLAVKKFDGYSIKLIKLLPYPEVGTNAGKSYVATLLVSYEDKTASWKTYQSSEMAFSIKYPADWGFSSESAVPDGRVADFSKNNDSGLSVWKGTPYSQSLKRNYTLEEWIDAEKIAIQKNYMDLNETKVPLDNTIATRLSYKNIQGNVINDTMYYIYVQDRNGNFYKIQATIKSAEIDVYAPIFYQMISSFHFLY